MDRDFALSSHRWRKSRVLAPLLISWTSLGLGLAGNAYALGVDGPLIHSALGQALNLVFPVLLKPGEKLSAECVQVDVYAGEARVPPNMLQVALEGESEGSVRAVRVYSPLAVNEPLVHVTLNLGCPNQLNRQYTAFIDPPGSALASGGAAAGSTSRPPQYTPAMRAALAAAGARPEELLAGSARPAATVSSVLQRSDTSSRPALATVAVAQPRSEPKDRTRPLAFRSVSVKATPAGALLAAPGPRLRLDPPGEDEAAESALAHIAAAEVALLRLRQLEETLNRLQADNQRSRNKVQALRSQLDVAAADDGPSLALLGLGALSIGLAAFSAFLWRSRSRERAERDGAWWAGGSVDMGQAHSLDAGAESLPPEQSRHSLSASFPSSREVVAEAIATVPPPAPGWASAAHPDERTITMPPSDAADFASDRASLMAAHVADDGTADRSAAAASTPDDVNSGPLSIQLIDSPTNFVNDTGVFTAPVPLNVTAVGNDHVTVEELIDLEQQVEFFLVLGQSEAAVELLQARINFGGASALPYLKLLEIHQRQGEELYFKEVAASFAKRFDALAPTWGSDLNQGRDLEAYPTVLQRVAARWPDAAASMALMQELLSRGGDSGHGFDLPAYRELLFLYSVARDRSEHEVRSDEIDLFLPLDTQNKSGDGHQLMATMIWQGKEMPGPQHALEVDISLDEPEVEAPSPDVSRPH